MIPFDTSPSRASFQTPPKNPSLNFHIANLRSSSIAPSQKPSLNLNNLPVIRLRLDPFHQKSTVSGPYPPANSYTHRIASACPSRVWRRRSRVQHHPSASSLPHQHVPEVVALCDRFRDSFLAYLAAAPRLPPRYVFSVQTFFHQTLRLFVFFGRELATKATRHRYHSH